MADNDDGYRRRMLLGIVQHMDANVRNLKRQSEQPGSVATVKLGEAVNAANAVRDGKVWADVAGEFAEAPIAVSSGAEVRVACSTGQFMFEKLEMAAAD